MELVFTADLHLADRAWKRATEVRGDAYRSFDQIIQYCADHKDRVSALVLGGDVFDARPSAADVAHFLRGVRLLAKLDVKIYAIQGQHGRSQDVPWTSVDPYVFWLHGAQPVELPGPVVMTGFDNLPPDELQEQLKSLDPKVDIVVVHQKCRGCLPEIAEVQNWDFDPEWVPSHVRLVLMGDIHKEWETTVARKHGTEKIGMPCVYSGSICMQDVTEPPDKSFLVVDLNRAFTYRRVPLKTRPFTSFTLQTEKEFTDSLEQVAKLEPETLVLVKHDSRISDVEGRLKAINNKVHYLLRLLPLEIVEGEALEIDTGDTPPEKVTLQGCLDSVVDKGKEGQLHSMLLQLLDTRDPHGTLKTIKDKFLAGDAADVGADGKMEVEVSGDNGTPKEEEPADVAPEGVEPCADEESGPLEL